MIARRSPKRSPGGGSAVVFVLIALVIIAMIIFASS